MLKFEELVKVGDTIKAFDFEPIPGRPDKFVVGEVVRFDVHAREGVRCFIIECTEDSVWADDPEYTRVGYECWVPMETLFDYDSRVTVVK